MTHPLLPGVGVCVYLAGGRGGVGIGNGRNDGDEGDDGGDGGGGGDGAVSTRGFPQ